MGPSRTDCSTCFGTDANPKLEIPMSSKNSLMHRVAAALEDLRVVLAIFFGLLGVILWCADPTRSGLNFWAARLHLLAALVFAASWWMSSRSRKK